MDRFWFRSFSNGFGFGFDFFRFFQSDGFGFSFWPIGFGFGFDFFRFFKSVSFGFFRLFSVLISVFLHQIFYKNGRFGQNLNKYYGLKQFLLFFKICIFLKRMIYSANLKKYAWVSHACVSPFSILR